MTKDNHQTEYVEAVTIHLTNGEALLIKIVGVNTPISPGVLYICISESFYQELTLPLIQQFFVSL